MPQQTSDWRVLRTDKDVYAVQHCETVVGLMVRLSNGQWHACDANERALSKRQFPKPHHGIAFFKDRQS